MDEIAKIEKMHECNAKEYFGWKDGWMLKIQCFAKL